MKRGDNVDAVRGEKVGSGRSPSSSEKSEKSSFRNSWTGFDEFLSVGVVLICSCKCCSYKLDFSNLIKLPFSRH